MARLYTVVCEGRGILNPGERGFRSLDKARDLCASAREECSWECLTPPGDDNAEGGRTSGKFRCGTLSPHGIRITIDEGGRTVEPSVQDLGLDPEPEKFRATKNTRRADWVLEYVIDRGTGYAADGENHLFYVGPDMTTDYWDSLLESIAGDDEIIEARVTPTLHGRYHHLREESEYANGAYMEWSTHRGEFVQ